MEQVDAWLDGYLGARLDQLRQLVVAETVEAGAARLDGHVAPAAK